MCEPLEGPRRHAPRRQQDGAQDPQNGGSDTSEHIKHPQRMRRTRRSGKLEAELLRPLGKWLPYDEVHQHDYRKQHEKVGDTPIVSTVILRDNTGKILNARAFETGPYGVGGDSLMLNDARWEIDSALREWAGANRTVPLPR